MGRRWATRTGGWLAVALGAVHMVVAPWDERTHVRAVGRDGVWNTVTLDEPTTRDESERSRVFWLTLGSFGAPLAALGGWVVWSERRGRRVPAGVGWGLLAWGLPFVAVLPASPGWVIPVIGGLIAAGDDGTELRTAPGR